MSPKRVCTFTRGPAALVEAALSMGVSATGCTGSEGAVVDDAAVLGVSLLLLQPDALQEIANAAQPSRAMCSLFMGSEMKGPKVIHKSSSGKVSIMNMVVIESL